jgi:hypothetical protein
MNFALGGERVESKGGSDEAAERESKQSSDVFIVHAS